MNLASLLPRRLARWWAERTPAPSTASRAEVCPPQRWPSSLSWQGRLQRWRLQRAQTAASGADTAAPVPAALDDARQAFVQCLGDLSDAHARQLIDRVARARSMRDLWHLRSSLYGAVATEHSQTEAERRIERLNQHFPVRSARTPRPHPCETP